MYKTDISRKKKKEYIGLSSNLSGYSLLSQHIKICEVIFPKRKATTILPTKEISLTSLSIQQGVELQREEEKPYLASYLALTLFPLFPWSLWGERKRENWSQMKVQSKRDTLGLIFPLYPFLLLFSVQFECLREEIGPHT